MISVGREIIFICGQKWIIRQPLHSYFFSLEYRIVYRTVDEHWPFKQSTNDVRLGTLPDFVVRGNSDALQFKSIKCSFAKPPNAGKSCKKIFFPLTEFLPQPAILVGWGPEPFFNPCYFLFNSCFSWECLCRPLRL